MTSSAEQRTAIYVLVVQGHDGGIAQGHGIAEMRGIPKTALHPSRPTALQTPYPLLRYSMVLLFRIFFSN